MDVKTKTCDNRYTEAASAEVASAVNKKQGRVNRDYHDRARKLDEDQGMETGEEGPFTKILKQHGKDGGRVLAPIVGPFAEMSSHVYVIADLISSLLASEHSSYFTEKPSEAKGMFSIGSIVHGDPVRIGFSWIAAGISFRCRSFGAMASQEDGTWKK